MRQKWTREWLPAISAYSNRRAWISGTAPHHGQFLSDISDENKTPAVDALLSRTASFLSSFNYRSSYENARLAQILVAQTNAMSGSTVSVNGITQEVGPFGSISMPSNFLRTGFRLERTNRGLGFLNIEVVGARNTLDSVDNGFRVNKRIFDHKGVQVYSDGGEFVADQGNLFTVVIDVVRTGRRIKGNLLVTDLLPSGFEIENGTLDVEQFLGEDGSPVDVDLDDSDKPRYIQNMDDRFVAEYSQSWRKGSSVTVQYVMRAVYQGTMTVPDTHAEMMYYPERNGRSAFGRAEITRK